MGAKLTARPRPTSHKVLAPHDFKKQNKKRHTNGLPFSVHEELPTKELLEKLKEVKNGNFAVRLPSDEDGMTGKIFDTLNDIIAMNEAMMREFTRARNTIGREGKLTQRIALPGAK